MTLHLPAETAMALALALTNPQYDLHAKRTAAEAAIEDLINFLDDTEGDPDLEPWLAGTDGDDREGDELEGYQGESDGGADDEPWLGWVGDGRTITEAMASDGDREEDGCEYEDGHDAEQTNEDGGNVTDEPHDEVDEGNDEYSLDGIQPDGPSGGWGMSYDEAQACKSEVRAMLAKVPSSGVRPAQMITGPDGRLYRFVS